MGSLRFVSSRPQQLGAVIAEAAAADTDGVPIEIAVNLDQAGDLFELDMWKVDFSPVQHFPNAEELTISR